MQGTLQLSMIEGAGTTATFQVELHLPLGLRRRLVPDTNAPLGADHRAEAGQVVRRYGKEGLPARDLPPGSPHVGG